MLQRAFGKIHPYMKATRLGNVYLKRERLLCSALLFCCPNSYACRAGRGVKAAMTIARGATEATRHLHSVALKQPGWRIEHKSRRKKNPTQTTKQYTPPTTIPTATILSLPSGRKSTKKIKDFENRHSKLLAANVIHYHQQMLLNIFTAKGGRAQGR